MLMPTSSEFTTLCQAQISLLTQGLGASLAVVYLRQQLAEDAEAHLIPIVVYPDSLGERSEQMMRQLPQAELQAQLIVSPSDSPSNSPSDASSASPSDPGLEQRPDTRQADRAAARIGNPALDRRDTEPQVTASRDRDTSRDNALVAQRQIVLPLIHEEVVLGLLVAGRNDRAWTDWEQTQIQQIASTIALACVLDQRYQWLEHERQEQRLLQAQQHDLLDNLLHQFRNSLTALQTFGKLILKRLLPGDPNREIAASLVRETARLRELSQQLEMATRVRDPREPRSLPPVPVDWTADSSSDTGSGAPLSLLPASGLLPGSALPLTPCSVEPILAPLLASAGTIAQDRTLHLHTLIPEHLPPIQANAQALREVLNNLIENALKYTPAGGHVVVQATLSAGTGDAPRLEISISDTGPGIPAQDLPHLFQRHYRGVQAQTGIPGSGLGLAIAKTLVEQMQGEIQVFSPARQVDLAPLALADTGQGVGVTFVVRLFLA